MSRNHTSNPNLIMCGHDAKGIVVDCVSHEQILYESSCAKTPKRREVSDLRCLGMKTSAGETVRGHHLRVECTDFYGNN